MNFKFDVVLEMNWKVPNQTNSFRDSLIFEYLRSDVRRENSNSILVDRVGMCYLVMGFNPLRATQYFNALCPLWSRYMITALASKY